MPLVVTLQGQNGVVKKALYVPEGEVVAVKVRMNVVGVCDIAEMCV